MPLSLTKLTDLIQAKGYVPYQYFTIDNMCVYMLVMSLKTAELFLLYFPSSYKFEVPFRENVFRMKYVDLRENENVSDEYAGEPEEDIDVSIQLSPDNKGTMENHLETNYNQPINLKDISREELNELQGIYRQLKRLRNCVHHIKYKVAILYKNYMCAVHRDGVIDTLFIKHYSSSKPSKNLLVVIDIELFYDKSERLAEDLQTVRQGIYKVLERNHIFHSQIMDKMMDTKKNSDKIALETIQKKQKYSQYISNLETMLTGLVNAEDRKAKEFRQLEKLDDSLSNDITRTHRKSLLERELNHIQSLKEDIIKLLLWTKEKREHTLLSVDKIMFDNTVMFDCIVKNFVKLNNFH